MKLFWGLFEAHLSPLEKAIPMIVKQITSGRFISTVCIVGSYCLAMLLIVHTCNKLLILNNPLGKEILIFIIGNFTGTCMGAVVAYHFKKEGEKKEEVK